MCVFPGDWPQRNSEELQEAQWRGRGSWSLVQCYTHPLRHLPPTPEHTGYVRVSISHQLEHISPNNIHYTRLFIETNQGISLFFFSPSFSPPPLPLWGSISESLTTGSVMCNYSVTPGCPLPNPGSSLTAPDSSPVGHNLHARAQVVSHGGAELRRLSGLWGLSKFPKAVSCG